MKLLRKLIIATVSLTIAGVAYAVPSTAFTIDFDFETDGVSSASTTSGTGDFASIGAFSGGSVSGGSLTSGGLTNFAFNFDIAPGFVATITKIIATTTYQGPMLALHLTTVNSTPALFGATSPVGTGEFTTSPGYSYEIGDGGSAAFNVYALSLGSFSLENFTVEGTIAAVPETSTMLLGGLGSILVFALGYKRRKDAAVAA
ncbi:hypothetical protein [Pelagicoccus sp. SDUM812005]|uniref:hypothetical protein n=1 Tax=Pelagicoccus sp. SDUM812005 TaxID=3041257 RepID=UPI00280C4A4F|nr:hypothetical protein [Pelagicoccus sp. SDUM812005]MDQ8183705.1 hypothetical protein [Pelagicoccus sp. SDUM812005]